MKHQFPIFISYRHADTADKAEHLLTLLEAGGYKGRVSFDRENLDGQFDLEILQRLDDCTDFIAILGENTLNGIKDEGVHFVYIYQYEDGEVNARMEILPDEF